MKKNVLLFLGKGLSSPTLLKIYLICITTVFSIVASAQNTFNVANGNWNTAANWSLNHVPNGTENLVIPSGSTCTMDVNYTGGNTFTITIGGTLNIPAGITLDRTAATILMNVNGATISGGGSINIYTLTINTPNATDVVNITNSSNAAPVTIGKDNATGTINFTKGILKLTGQTLAISKIATINGNGGNFANGADGVVGHTNADGGTLLLKGNSGGTTTVNGTVVFNDVDFGGSDGNVVLDLKTSTSVINGIAKIVNQQGKLGNSNSPIWGAASTLSIVYNSAFNYNPGKEWVSMASGTIGVTPGYPNNVIMSNTGTSAGGFNNGNGWVPNGSWAINGVLTLGNNSTNAQVDFSNVSSFSCGGFVLNTNSRFTAPKATMTVNGNWTNNQAVSGNTKGFFINSTSTVVFSGSALCSAPNTITAPAGNAETFNNLSINTNISLLSPVTVNTTGILTLISGAVSTTTSNILTVNNTSTSAISGGSASAFINGPIARNLAATAGNYVFPVGNGTCAATYLPFTINKPASNATVATVQAFNTGSGGTHDASITSLSTTEYWSMTTTAPFTNGANVSVSRSTPLGSVNMLAMSQTTASGIYTAIGGTVGANDVTNAGTIGNNSPWFFTLAQGPLILRIVQVVSPKCNGTVGSVTVGGSGGTAPYQYATETGAFSSNNLFENLVAGKYIFRVKDADGTIASATVILKPLSTIADTSVCGGNSVTLTTSGAFSYSWTSSPAGFTSTLASPTVTPSVNTTYYVNALILDNSVNMITNGNFEAGATGFTSDYINLTGNGQIPYNAAGDVAAVGSASHNGIYAIVGASNNLCNFFTPAFNDHTTGSGKMMVADGPSNGVANQVMWSQNVTVIPGNSYVLSYYFSNANNNATSANIQTMINGTAVTTSAGFSANPYATSPAGAAGWKQVSYFWTAPTGVTTAAISLIDLVNNADIGNDFAIDDITMYNTCIVTDSVKVNVSSTPPTVTSPITYCQNATAVPLTAVGTNLKWYDNNNVLLGAAPTPVTTAIGTTNYFVSQTPAGGCSESSKATIVVSVTAPNTVPTFAPVAAICAGATLNALPTTSTNNIVGTWSPALNNQGTTTYTFTPNQGQCATTTTLQIAVNQPVTPTFAPVAAICAGATLNPLPTTSTNNISGTWSPALNNQGTTTYTFTPNEGQCATTTTLQIAVNQPVTPTFTPVAAICAGATLNALPTTSTNNISGTWSPALNNQGTTTYTFTPNQGQCATTTTLQIAVNQPVTPTFAQVAPICAGATLNALPTTSTNNISGTWSPALNNTQTTTYTFTPNQGQCASTTTLQIQVIQLPIVSAGPNLSVVRNQPITITGTSNSEGVYTWSPATGINPTNSLTTVAQLTEVGTYVYTLNVQSGNCSASDDMTLTVTPDVDCLDPMRGFTPNGDGKNDRWIVFNDEGCFAKVQVAVYNRYGGLVYQSNKYTNNWTGEFKGKPVPDATYYYVIKATSVNGKTTVKTGNVTIIR
ncbi:gliding motility-associated C-terminal domain-containing protein [Ferruginibacter sp. SUN002]|uniref:T9SS type B sorting domain-containing protein n=1 Tax=Ferruginibacter sp. SUN002 TaxID=2937789 RepID=UPI003D35FB41